MGSSNAPDATSTFRELDQLVRHLGEELAAFRRRALQAEARVRALEAAGGKHDLFVEQRLETMEKENAELRTRLGIATERTRQLLDRVRFLRQQHEREGAR